jgi:uracil-DNA glycosylase
MTTGNPAYVPPCTGWPEDPAAPGTPVATTAADVRRLAAEADGVDELCARESVCRACPRLVEWRERVAVERRRAYADQTYWGRPVPGWGDPEPSILIVGLAPAAHGGNRTGRIFTGDRSGDWLFASLHRVGLAARPTSTHAGDGQRLLGARVVAAVRCAPPDNKPTPQERETCAPWLTAELAHVAASVASIVVLGGYGWQALWPSLRREGYALPDRRPPFKHGREVRLRPPPAEAVAGGPPAIDEVLLLGCYHPSQQNTFTGRVTEDMLDAIFRRARDHAREHTRGAGRDHDR